MPGDALWYKDAVIYEVHVRAFHDSDGDGIGDFKGLTQKLDYLEDLGVTCVWVLPFYPSPLRDDGYDIADYLSVHPDYGTLDDVKTFLAEAHRRGIRVVTELVVNHTSDQHPWFQAARRAPQGSPERDFYVWSDDPQKYAGVGLMFPDFETSNWAWDAVAGQYYWHRFYGHQPDLNFDNRAVWDALLPAVDFWFGLGVDGMRLDAVPYLYEREGTSCEHLPETHAFLKHLRKHVDARFPDRMLLAEANAWPEDMVSYFGAGDECQMAFHFPLMPRLYMAVHQEDRFPIIDVLAQTPAIPDNCQWGLFLRNHDEMTLAMVTDEERDDLWRAYAKDKRAKIFQGIRHRLAPLLGNDRRRIELLTGLLFSLPGTPVLYYGDEIGMGDNIYLGDRNGVRTPMQWSGDRNAGFSKANPQALYLPVVTDPEYHYEAVNVEAQQSNTSSLLWWTKRLIALRKRHRAFGRGGIEYLAPANNKVLAFVRTLDGEAVLVAANLSRFTQHAELDLKAYRGTTPEELAGRSLFPPVGDGPYPLTLGPYAFYWFKLHAADVPQVVGDDVPALPVLTDWHELTDGPGRDELELVLPKYCEKRLPDGRRQDVTGCRILASTVVSPGGVDARLLSVKVEYAAGSPETVLLPLAFVPDDQAGDLLGPPALAAVARVTGGETGWLCDGVAVPAYVRAVAAAVATGRVVPTAAGELATVPLPGFELPPADAPLSMIRGGRHALSVKFGDTLVFKPFRRLDDGVNPDLEVGRFLQDRFPGVATIVGYVALRRKTAEPITLAVLKQWVPSQGDAWQQALDLLGRFFEAVAAQNPRFSDRAAPDELAGEALDFGRRLGDFLASLHKAVAAADLPGLAPEPYTPGYQRSVYQTLRNRAAAVWARLDAPAADWPDPVRALAAAVRPRRDDLLEHFKGALDPAVLGAVRIRCHGDFHLGKLLVTGRGFVLTDYEGDPLRPVSERRLKRNGLRDLACLVRSLDYAAGTAVGELTDARGRVPGVIRPEDRATLVPFADGWRERVGREVVTAYTAGVGGAGLLPRDAAAGDRLLRLLELERALEEIDYDLEVRPAWAAIPLAAVLRLLG